MSSLNTADFTGSAVFIPQGQWNLPANVSTSPTHALWLNQGSSLQSLSDTTDNAVMNTAGTIIVPYSGRFDLYAFISSTDWAFNGTMTVTLTYTPVNTASQSPTYTLGSFTLTPTNTQASVEQRVFANAGDQITIAFAPTTTVNTSVISNPTSTLNFTDVTNDPTELYFYGVSGKVPSFASLNKSCVMQTASFTNGVASLCLTQDATVSGTPLFTQIVGISAIPQAPSTITGPLGVGCISINPIPTNMKTLTINLAVNGALPASGWTVIAQIYGY